MNFYECKFVNWPDLRNWLDSLSTDPASTLQIFPIISSERSAFDYRRSRFLISIQIQMSWAMNFESEIKFNQSAYVFRIANFDDHHDVRRARRARRCSIRLIDWPDQILEMVSHLLNLRSSKQDVLNKKFLVLWGSFQTTMKPIGRFVQLFWIRISDLEFLNVHPNENSCY